MLFSTPLICCSSGVATDASTSVALAPMNVVVTWIIGGTISGYCAIGRPFIATTPSRMVMIEITIATMGWLTKNRDMTYFASPPAAGAGFGVTVVPSATRWRPSTMTLSPTFTPSSMTQDESTLGPTLTLLNDTLLSAPTS